MREIKFCGTIDGITYKEQSGLLSKGSPLPDAPKTYKKLTVIGHNIGNLYNPSHMIIFRAKDRTLRYEIYRDGSIYPYYGKFEIVEGK